MSFLKSIFVAAVFAVALAGFTNPGLAEGPHKLALQISDNDPVKMNTVLNVAANVSRHYSDLGEEIEIESWISDIASRTFRMDHHVQCGDREICTGFEVRGCFVEDENKQGGIRALPIPPELRKALS